MSLIINNCYTDWEKHFNTRNPGSTIDDAVVTAQCEQEVYWHETMGLAAGALRLYLGREDELLGETNLPVKASALFHSMPTMHKVKLDDYCVKLHIQTPTADAIHAGKYRRDKILFTKAPLTTLKHEHSTFDYGVFYHTLEHVSNATMLKLIGRMRHVLKRGAIMVVKAQIKKPGHLKAVVTIGNVDMQTRPKEEYLEALYANNMDILHTSVWNPEWTDYPEVIILATARVENFIVYNIDPAEEADPAAYYQMLLKESQLFRKAMDADEDTTSSQVYQVKAWYQAGLTQAVEGVAPPLKFRTGPDHTLHWEKPELKLPYEIKEKFVYFSDKDLDDITLGDAMARESKRLTTANAWADKLTDLEANNPIPGIKQKRIYKNKHQRPPSQVIQPTQKQKFAVKHLNLNHKRQVVPPKDAQTQYLFQDSQ